MECAPAPRRGGYGGLELENVYQEVGSCANPLGKIGQAGVIAQGGSVRSTEARRRLAGFPLLPVREAGLPLLRSRPAR